MSCRKCGQNLENVLDLGSAPPSNAYIDEKKLDAYEKWYPLKVSVCTSCFLVQVRDYIGREELFSNDYAYFSSYSSGWLAHCEKYAVNITQELALNEKSMVGEIASNDGYLLQYFKRKDIPCYGVEPTKSTVEISRQKGLKIFDDFFGFNCAMELSRKNYQSDLLIANNVLAHVPNITDFVKGIAVLLKEKGVATFEFPHVYELVTKFQFDTIYHEHFSYLSFSTVNNIFVSNGLSIFKVERLNTHGGSLRVYAQRADTGMREIDSSVYDLLQFEDDTGVNSTLFYHCLEKDARSIKAQFISFLLSAQNKQEKVVAYGAAAKGNTLLNYSGIKQDLISYVVDRNPAKINKYMPGSRLPILSEDTLVRDEPKWIVIFPWNIKEEIVNQLSYVRDWGGEFVTAIPKLEMF